ncbi:Thioesterase/thiol ester dehydrase-isomerase, partial [Pluteus cervinus]
PHMADDSTTHASTSEISGNAPEEVKELLASANYVPQANQPPTFADSIIKRTKTVEVSVVNKAEEPTRKEGRVVCEVLVEEDMTNGYGSVHGGCLALLIDQCSTMALYALQMSTVGEPFFGVSQSLNIVYHSPALLGDTLRIVNTTMTVGSRAVSVRAEVWSKTYHRLVASGVHIKMQPSSEKAKL